MQATRWVVHMAAVGGYLGRNDKTAQNWGTVVQDLQIAYKAVSPENAEDHATHLRSGWKGKRYPDARVREVFQDRDGQWHMV